MGRTAVTVNVASHLTAWAARQPDAVAVVVARRNSYTSWTTAELDRASDRAAFVLKKSGIGRGVRAVLMVPARLEFFALIFGMLKVGAVPIVIDPGMGLRNVRRCLRAVEPTAFIGIPRAQVASMVFNWCRRSIRHRITLGAWGLFGGLRSASDPKRGEPSYPTITPAPGEEAAIFFTSGSTGPPKGVVSTHEVLAAQVRALRDAFELAPGGRDLATVPPLALFAPALEITTVIPWMDFSRPAKADPHRLVEAIERFNCTSMFASPAIVAKLGQHCAKRNIRLNTLRCVISAGAPASTPALGQMRAALPDDAKLYTPYGATEAMPISLIESRDILNETSRMTAVGAGVCVGNPLPEVSVRIFGITDGPVPSSTLNSELPPGSIGEVAVSGPVVSPRYCGIQDLQVQAKVTLPDGSLWHRTGDLGYLDQHGRLWLCGRLSQRVQLPAGDLYTLCCEGVFNTRAGVARCALVGVQRKGSLVPVLCVEPRHPMQAAARHRLTAELLEVAKSFDHTRAIRDVLYCRRFPMDVRHNAKILREQLALWASRCLR